VKNRTRNWRQAGLALVVGLVVAAALPAYAQRGDDDVELNWRESEVPPPPALNTAHMVQIDMPSYSDMQVGVDVNSINVTSKDGVVRYVALLQGRDGSVSAYYQGVHCTNFAGRTYARYRFDHNPPGWENVQEDWFSLREKKSVYANMIARAGACETSVPATNTAAARRAYARNSKWRGRQFGGEQSQHAQEPAKQAQ